MAKSAVGSDPGGYRTEFISLARKAASLDGGLSGR